MMKIQILSSSVDQELCQYGTTYLINDFIAVDAGSLGFCGLARQRAVRHVLLSHAHLDHISSLPQFLDNVYCPGRPCPKVYGSEHVLGILQQHFFNDEVWPDLVRLGREKSVQFAEFIPLRPGTAVDLEGLRFTPVPLDHTVPCLGFVIESESAAIVLASDTGPTETIWRAARNCANLRAVFVEAAFPNCQTQLADCSKHLTPAMLLDEYRKLARETPVYAVHMKPAYHAQVAQELAELPIEQLIVAEPNVEYVF